MTSSAARAAASFEVLNYHIRNSSLDRIEPVTWPPVRVDQGTIEMMYCGLLLAEFQSDAAI